VIGQHEQMHMSAVISKPQITCKLAEGVWSYGDWVRVTWPLCLSTASFHLRKGHMTWGTSLFWFLMCGVGDHRCVVVANQKLLDEHHYMSIAEHSSAKKMVITGED